MASIKEWRDRHHRARGQSQAGPRACARPSEPPRQEVDEVEEQLKGWGPKLYVGYDGALARQGAPLKAIGASYVVE